MLKVTAFHPETVNFLGVYASPAGVDHQGIITMFFLFFFLSSSHAQVFRIPLAAPPPPRLLCLPVVIVSIPCVRVQVQGRKRWRVFAPPPPSLRPNADPMARGKGADVLSLDELVGQGREEEILLDIVLEPGQVC